MSASIEREQLGTEIGIPHRLRRNIEAAHCHAAANARGTPKEIVERLNITINAALADPAMKQRFVDLGCAVFAGAPADFAKFIINETDKWANVVAFADIKPQ